MISSSYSPQSTRLKSTIGAAGPPRILFRLFYQVEIRRYQTHSSKTNGPLAAADARDPTMRLWKL